MTRLSLHHHQIAYLQQLTRSVFIKTFPGILETHFEKAFVLAPVYIAQPVSVREFAATGRISGNKFPLRSPLIRTPPGAVIYNILLFHNEIHRPPLYSRLTCKDICFFSMN